MVGFVGGRFGWDLSAAVKKGGDRQFVKGRFTQWANDPDVRGGYAYQRPGAAGARAALASPLAARLFFAGEATAGGMSMTCGGAFLTGERAAREVVDAPT